MRSDLNEFVTKYLSIVGATVMAVGFIAFVTTSYDEDRVIGQTTPTESASVASVGS